MSQESVMTYDRNRNAIKVGSRVMVSGTGEIGVITAIHGDNLPSEQIRRSKCVDIDNLSDRYVPTELVRLGMN